MSDLSNQLFVPMQRSLFWENVLTRLRAAAILPKKAAKPRQIKRLAGARTGD
jgi:hypothetical protein